MNYRELLRLYKDGKLSEEQKAEIEKELEKQEAISEFLYDQDELEFSGSDTDVPDGDTDVARSAAGHLSDFDLTKAIRSSIRRAFLKMGAAITAIVLVIVLLSQTILPKFMDRFYYDPTAIYHPVENRYPDFNASVFQVSMKVYSELFLPGRNIDSAYVESEGYGDYSFVLSTSLHPIGTQQPTYAGNIRKNKIAFYDPGQITTPPGNAFEWSTFGEWDYSRDLTSQLAEQDMSGMNSEEPYTEYETGDTDTPSPMPAYHTYGAMGGNKDDSREIIAELDDGSWCQAYITFEKVMSYDDALAYIEKNEIEDSWFAIVNGDFGNDVIGMYPNPTGGMIYQMNEKYPYLMGYEVEGDADIDFDLPHSEDFAKQHFISMLSYLSDQKQFSDMMQVDPHLNYCNDLQTLIKYIETNGLKVYGLSVRANKETLQKLIEDEAVYSIGVA